MKVRLEHITRLDYSTDVVEGVMDVRLGPLSDPDQRWDVFTINVSPNGSVRRFVRRKRFTSRQSLNGNWGRRSGLIRNWPRSWENSSPLVL